MKIRDKVVRQTLVFRVETWALEKAQENNLEVADMIMLR